MASLRFSSPLASNTLDAVPKWSMFEPMGLFMTRAAIILLLALPALAQPTDLERALDRPPLERPREMHLIGTSHFPVTSNVEGVQQWFDQGSTLLHNGWEYEAERAFRMCIALDPDCAMAYWGLARCAAPGSERHRIFLREAVARRDLASEREQRYIDAWARAFLPGQAAHASLAHELERICLEEPDDVEAMVLFAHEARREAPALAVDALLRDVLRRQPEHPGAHRERVLLWEGPDAAVAFDSSDALRVIAPETGGAEHLAGRTYAALGMWHESAIWTHWTLRVYQRAMERDLTLPGHRPAFIRARADLCFIHEQLGMPTFSISGARELLDLPFDLEWNDPDQPGPRTQGLQAIVRCLIRYERWEDILREGEIPWRDSNPVDRELRPYAECLALLGLGRLEEAVARRDLLAEAAPWRLEEIDARIELAKGNTLDGLAQLAAAAKLWRQRTSAASDATSDTHNLDVPLGEAYLHANAPALAVRAFERALESSPNDPFALAGLARANTSLGNTEEAARAGARLRFVWSAAEHAQLERLDALGLPPGTLDESPRYQRSYAEHALEPFGPPAFPPPAAPALSVFDSNRERITLADFRGRIVVLVFYLGEGCAHCVEQLIAFKSEAGAFQDRGVELLAVSADAPERNRASESLESVPFRLLSDEFLDNARRYHTIDEFAGEPVHGTFLIDEAGRMRWFRTGREPFMDLGFLLSEIDRLLGRPVEERMPSMQH